MDNIRVKIYNNGVCVVVNKTNNEEFFRGTILECKAFIDLYVMGFIELFK